MQEEAKNVLTKFRPRVQYAIAKQREEKRAGFPRMIESVEKREEMIGEGR
jgi:hypothetical protein